jgi:hypothetical protein
LWCLAFRPGCVVPTYGVDCREASGEADLLLPGGVRAGGRPAADRVAAVPGHCCGGAGAPVGHGDGCAGPDPAQAVRGPGRGVVGAGAAGCGRGHRPGGAAPRTRARRWAPTWRWRPPTGWWRRARSWGSPTGGPPRPARVGCGSHRRRWIIGGSGRRWTGFPSSSCGWSRPSLGGAWSPSSGWTFRGWWWR